MEYSVENLERVVTLFYRSEAGQQAEAHQWLTEAQNAPQAWSFVWELLNPQRSSEVQFFAATTLHTKLLKHWNELPEDHYEILKKRILESIINYAMGPKIILNRLCITLSAYIIRTISTHWPNAFEELVSSFQPQHLPNVEPERVIWILLEILTVIPEEFQNTILALYQKIRVRTLLQDVSKDILKVVEMCLTPLPNTGFDMSNLTTYLNASKCAAAWIQLGGLNIDDCITVTNLLVDLTCFVYWNKLEPDAIISEELEFVEITIEALTGIIQHPNTIKYNNHLLKFSANILYKFDKILDFERTLAESNKDVVAILYGLIITIADVHSRLFINNLKSEIQAERQISMDYFTTILKCTNTPGLYPLDETCSTLTFGFWYTLQDEIISLDTQECAQLLLIIKPYYRDLVCIMLNKSMYPNLTNSNWSLDDKEVFRCYRQDISDTFMYCYNVLNLEMLDILNNKLNESLNKIKIEWNEIETCLHGFSSVAECIELENLYLPKLMLIIKNIPYTTLNKKVMSSALDCVGSYSDWITIHPNMLENVLPLVIQAIDEIDVTTSATMALKDLTHSCQKYLKPYADHILISAQSALHSGKLKLAECSRLMFSIGKVLSILTFNQIMEYLNVILTPSFDEIQKLVTAEPENNVKTSLITRLKILSSLFSSLYVKKTTENAGEIIEQPTVIIMQNTMPLYKIIAEKYCRNIDVIEELSTLLKYLITTLLEDSAPLINDILQIIVTIYREYPQAHILNVAKTIVIMFGNDEQFRSLIHQLLHEIINTTLQMCAQLHGANQLSDKTDVLEGFFSMLSQIYKKIPNIILTSGIDTAALFQCAVLCLSLQEIQTLKLCSSFLVNFIQQSRDTSQSTIIQQYGENLVMRIMLNLGNSASRSTVDLFGDILLALNKKYCDNLSRWLNTLLAQENFPSPRITSQQKENFIRIILKEKTNKRKLSDSVLEFTLICRGILQGETALQ